MVIQSPASIAELGEIVVQATSVFVGDTQLFRNLNREAFATAISLRGFSGFVDIQTADQVAVIRSGTTLAEANHELRESGFCLPCQFAHLGPFQSLEGATLADLVSLNLPHPTAGTNGSWPDWILGMTVLLADGTTYKAGSRAVKNVAGYDLQKLLLGARYGLGIPIELILRIAPLATFRPGRNEKAEEYSGDRLVIQKTLRSDFAQVRSTFRGEIVAVDEEASTLFSIMHPGQDLVRYPQDWVLKSGFGSDNYMLVDATQTRFMKAAKGIFDPQSKLNPGEFGEF